MPWQEWTVEKRRREFVEFAQQTGVSMREVCHRFGISPKTGYKVLQRYREEGEAGLTDRSRRPHASPTTTAPDLVATICDLRRQYGWGGRKIHHYLQRQGGGGVPAPSTVTAILRREGLLTPDGPPVTGTFRRVERAASNDLWQMDFMGHRPLRQGRVHPLTILDDHSRYLLAVQALADERHVAVQEVLIGCFQRYGLPWTILTDNGPPWGTMGAPGWTQFHVWLLRLGITLWHGAPYHPQTQGKVERVHRTMSREVFGSQIFPDLRDTQAAFDAFRPVYNHDRPHDALANGVPHDRYRLSGRPYPEQLPEITYADDVTVRVVTAKGTIHYAGRRIQIGEAFQQLPVGLVATATDGVMQVRFAHHALGQVDLRPPRTEMCYLCP